jgi:hypothetical protein
MSALSKGSQFALFAFLLIATVALLFGFYDNARQGDGGANFIFAGAMYAIAALIYFLGRKTDRV